MDSKPPSGVTLAPGERVVKTWRFKESNLVVWIHWQATLTTNRLLISAPGTFLKVFPLGFQETSLPLVNLTDAGYRNQIVPLSAIVGGILLWLGLAVLAADGAGNPAGLLMVIVALLAFMAIIRPYITIANNRGAVVYAKTAVWDRKLAAAFVRELSDAISSHSQAVQVGSTAAPVSQTANSAMAELVNLRDQGFISKEEYEAKRLEILARI